MTVEPKDVKRVLGSTDVSDSDLNDLIDTRPNLGFDHGFVFHACLSIHPVYKIVPLVLCIVPPWYSPNYKW